MQKFLISLVIVLGLGILAPAAQATIWVEDFSNVSDWSAAEGATFISNGSVATLQDSTDGTGVAAWNSTKVPYATGDIISLVVSGVNSLQGTYWRLSAHQFNSSDAYLGELTLLDWSNSTGTFSSNFAGHHPDLATHVPALRISTPSGTGDATFDNLSVVPEPASLLLLGSGLLGLVTFSRRKK